MEYRTLWIDLETTGTDLRLHSIIQIAGIIEINEEVVETFNFKCRPTGICANPVALENIGFSLEELSTWGDWRVAYDDFVTILRKYIDPFDKEKIRFRLAGKNVRFDLSFLVDFFKLNGDQYIFSYINGKQQLEIGAIIDYCRYEGYINTPDSKLETIADHFGLEIKAHNALSDIIVTRQIHRELRKKLKYN